MSEPVNVSVGGTRKGKIHALALTAVMAAVICVVSPFAIPIGPVSLSLCTLVLYMTPYILGWYRGAAATLVFLLLGMAGMPVFTGFAGGMAKVLGPTGGYLAGYIPLVVITGLFIRLFPSRSLLHRALQLLGMVIATAVLYALGTAWFCFQSGNGLAYAMSICVFPFIPGDLIKMGIAVAVGPLIHDRLKAAGLLNC